MLANADAKLLFESMPLIFHLEQDRLLVLRIVNTQVDLGQAKIRGDNHIGYRD